MNTRNIASRIIPVLALGLLPLACEKGGDTPAEHAAARLTELSVDQVAALVSSAKPPKIYDANSEETRQKYGLLPGAIAIGSRDEIPSLLPEGKGEKLVFYCGSTMCRAAEGAAKKAVEAGYTDVNVMPAGITGWTQAGKPTRSLKDT